MEEGGKSEKAVKGRVAATGEPLPTVSQSFPPSSMC